MTARMTFMWTVVVLIFYDLVLCFFCCVLVYRTSFRQSCPLQVNLLFVRFCTPSVGRLGCHGRPQTATRLLQSTRSSAACCISASVGGCSYSLYVGRFPPGRHFPWDGSQRQNCWTRSDVGHRSWWPSHCSWHAWTNSDNGVLFTDSSRVKLETWSLREMLFMIRRKKLEAVLILHQHWTNSKFTWIGQDCRKLKNNKIATERTRSKIMEKKNYQYNVHYSQIVHPRNF